jgi:hypothetical protein
VHAGAGAPGISPGTPYFGFDIAKDIAYVASTGSSVLVLDGFGGVHRGGPVIPNAPITPYFGFNIARAIAPRTIPPRLGFTSANQGNQEVTSTTNVVIVSTALTAPDDGYVLVLGNASMGSNSAPDVAKAHVCLGVDSTACADSIEREVTIRSLLMNGGFASVAVSQAVFVNAGAHTFNLLVRKADAAGQVEYFDPTIVAVFVDHDGVGGS